MKAFYHIDPQPDGTVDVWLDPEARRTISKDGFREWEIRVQIVRGVVYYDGLEDDIRSRYEDWRASAETIRL